MDVYQALNENNHQSFVDYMATLSHDVQRRIIGNTLCDALTKQHINVAQYLLDPNQPWVPDTMVQNIEKNRPHAHIEWMKTLSHGYTRWLRATICPLPDLYWCIGLNISAETMGSRWYEECKDASYKNTFSRINAYMTTDWKHALHRDIRHYHLIETPTKEQACYVAFEPTLGFDCFYDLNRLPQWYPDIQSVLNVVEALEVEETSQHVLKHYVESIDRPERVSFVLPNISPN